MTWESRGRELEGKDAQVRGGFPEWSISEAGMILVMMWPLEEGVTVAAVGGPPALQSFPDSAPMSRLCMRLSRSAYLQLLPEFPLAS